MAETFVQLPAVVRIGVLPCGAHVRAIVGTSKNPLSSRKPKWAPSSAVFFYARPDLLLPIPNGLLVALPVAFGGLLATPAHGAHQLPDIRYRIPNAKLSMDEFSDSAQRPEVCRIACFQGAFEQQARQAFSLSLRQQWSSPRRGLHAQSSLALGSIGLLPSNHGAQ